MPARPRTKRLPPPDHPRDLPATSVHHPHVITSTAFNSWHNQRHPRQNETVEKRLRARHLERAAPTEYLWLMGTGGVHVFTGSLGGGRYGRHELVYAPTLPAGQLVLVRVEFVVEPTDR